MLQTANATLWKDLKDNIDIILEADAFADLATRAPPQLGEGGLVHPFREKDAIVALQDRGEYFCGINLIKSVSWRCSFNSAPIAKSSIAIASS